MYIIRIIKELVGSAIYSAAQGGEPFFSPGTSVERRGGRPINPTTGSTIANRVDRSTRREPSAFERNTGELLC